MATAGAKALNEFDKHLEGASARSELSHRLHSIESEIVRRNESAQRAEMDAASEREAVSHLRRLANEYEDMLSEPEDFPPHPLGVAVIPSLEPRREQVEA